VVGNSAQNAFSPLSARSHDVAMFSALEIDRQVSPDLIVYVLLVHFPGAVGVGVGLVKLEAWFMICSQ